MSRSRPDIVPRHMYWVLLGVLLLPTTSRIFPWTEASTLFLFLFSIMSMLLRWRFTLPAWSMLIDVFIVGILSLHNPANTVFLPLFIFHFCAKGTPLYVIPALLFMLPHPNAFAFMLLFFAVITGYLLLLWERQRRELQDQLDRLRQQSYVMERVEESLREDQFAIERMSRMEERQRIAEILHDTLGHELTAAQLTAQAAQTLLAQGEVEKTKRMQEKTRERLVHAMKQLKETVERVEPLDGNDMQSIDDLIRSFGFPIEFSHKGDYSVVPAFIRRVGYISLQEALTNIFKHTEPTKVTITVEISEVILRIVIENDGVESNGDIQPGHGLRFMRKRIEDVGGSLSIQQGSIFRLIIILPIQEPIR